MFHLLAYYQSVNPAGVLTNIAPVPDQAIRSTATGFTIPADVANLVAEAALTAATGPVYAQVQSPSLRQLTNQDVLPVIAGVTFGSLPPIQDHFERPRALKGSEELDFAIQATGGAAAACYGLCWLADAPMREVTGNVFSVRATGAAALAAGTWVNTALTFDSTLPGGTYQVVGMRAQGANLVAARLSFVGAGYRPGVPAVNAVGHNDYRYLRMGRRGAFGVFDVNQPPTLDCLGVTDTAQNVVLDLIKVS
jgi:hypothetical protein